MAKAAIAAVEELLDAADACAGAEPLVCPIFWPERLITVNPADISVPFHSQMSIGLTCVKTPSNAVKLDVLTKHLVVFVNFHQAEPLNRRHLSSDLHLPEPQDIVTLGNHELKRRDIAW